MNTDAFISIMFVLIVATIVISIMLTAVTDRFAHWFISVIIIATAATFWIGELQRTKVEYESTHSVQLTSDGAPFIEDGKLIELGTLFSVNLQKDDVITKITTEYTTNITGTKTYSTRYELRKAEN